MERYIWANEAVTIGLNGLAMGLGSRTAIQDLNHTLLRNAWKPTRNKRHTLPQGNDVDSKQLKNGSEVLPPESNSNAEPLEQVQYDAEYNVFANVRQHSEQPESISNTCVVEKVDSNVIPDSPDMCDNDIQTDQNAEDERVALANLIANLTLDTEENKKILKQLKKANASLTQ
ncbi:hypothetical protein Tco_1084941 [Tanacetum coccineum]